MRLARAVICLSVGFLVAQVLFYYPNLPARIASHFDASGAPDGWTTKESFLIFESIILFIILCEFTVLPLLIEKMPDNLINLPNKKFWLAPERRKETFFVTRNYFEWFAAGLLGLFIAVNQMTFKANINQTALPPVIMWTIIGAFVLFTILWMIKFVRHFKITK